jgi:hypothetical protein
MVYWLVGHIGGLTCWSARCLRLVVVVVFAMLACVCVICGLARGDGYVRAV